MNSIASRCDAILSLARSIGACAAGFAAAGALTASELAVFERWIADGRHAGMDYMEKYADLRADPRLLLDGTRSVLCMAFPYGPAERRHPLFSDYALGEDYHTVLRSALEPVAAAMKEAAPGSDTRICIDTAPIRERVWAVRAGIGFVGLNNLLIVPGVGSKVFLAEILWTADARPSSEPMRTTCEGCGACVKACPGRALDGCGGLDARRCLSYLTIEHRGDFPEGLSLAGRRIYGCDVCQDVCPHNSGIKNTILPSFTPSDELMALTLEEAADISDEDFRRIFRRSAVKRTKAAGLRRNAAGAKPGKIV